MIFNLLRKTSIAITIAAVGVLYQAFQTAPVIDTEISNSGVANTATSIAEAPWYLNPAIPAATFGLMALAILGASRCRNHDEFQDYLEGRDIEAHDDAPNSDHIAVSCAP